MLRKKLQRARPPRSWRRRIQEIRLPGLLSGFGLLLRLELLLIAALTIQTDFYRFPTMTTRQIGHVLLWTATGYARGLLLPMPLVVAALNLAPRDASRRLVWLFAIALGYGTVASWLGPLTSEEVAFFAFAALITAVHEYRHRAAVSESSLQRAQIDGVELEGALTRARLQLLRAQIEPHFLFNTLATVRTLARSNRPAAATVLSALIHYLSAALPSLQNDELPLSEEGALVESYLAIHKLRMGRRLRYQVTIPRELSALRIPSMMLLTLVENSIKHGLAPLPEGGEIKVNVRDCAGMLEVSVTDSGRGLQSDSGTGKGLANIRARLGLRHNGGAELRLSPVQPRGLQVTIVLPIDPAFAAAMG